MSTQHANFALKPPQPTTTKLKSPSSVKKGKTLWRFLANYLGTAAYTSSWNTGYANTKAK